MKQVDKYFKDKIKNHESDVSDDLWDKIAVALEEEPRKPRGVLWFSSLIGILLMTAGLFYYGLTSNDSIGGGEHEGSISVESGPVTTAVGVGKVANDRNQINNIQEKRNSNITAKETAEGAVNKIDDSKEMEVGDSKLYEESPEDDLVDDNLHKTVSKIAGTMSRVTDSSGFIQGEISDIDNESSEFKLVITKSYFDGSSSVAEANTTMTLANEERTEVKEISFISLPIDNMSVKDNIGDLGLKLFGKATPQCPSFIKERLGFFVDGYISHSFAFNNYRGAQQYVSDKNATESSLYSYGAGVRFSIFLAKGFGIRSGVSYSQSNQKFAIDDPNATETRIRIVEDIEISAAGDTTIVKREEVIQVEGRRQVTQHNRYHYLDIPILLFYEFGRKNSPFYYSVNAGTLVNLSFRQTAKYLADTGAIATAEGDDEYPNPYNSTAGVSLYASFGIHYMLNDHIDLQVEPHFYTQLSNQFEDSFALENRVTTLGINTGIRYKF